MAAKNQMGQQAIWRPRCPEKISGIESIGEKQRLENWD
jgi:hypothetical protein